MPNYLSPGNYFQEVDISEYPPSINSSVVGIVGFASKGPVAGRDGEKATLITSQENLIKTFGKPSSDIDGQALEGALEILEATNSLYFIRCTDGNEVAASASVPVGGCPALWVSAAPGDGVTSFNIGSNESAVSAVRITVDVFDNDRTQKLTRKVFDIPKGTTTGGTTTQGLTSIMGGANDGDFVGAFGDSTSSFIVGLGAGSGATVSAHFQINNATDGTTTGTWQDAPALREVNQLGEQEGTAAANFVSSGTTIDVTAGDGLRYFVRSLYGGAGSNEGTNKFGDTSGVSFEVDFTGGDDSIVQVNVDGTAAETFKGGLTSSVFMEDIIETTLADATSEHVFGFFASGSNGVTQLASNDSLDNFHDRVGTLVSDLSLQGSHGGQAVNPLNPRFPKLVAGTYSLAGGSNGIPAAAADQETELIGAVQSDGGRTGIEALDEESVNVRFALVPDFSEMDGVQNALITKAEATQKFLALVSPPYAVGKPSDAIEWHNGQSTDRTAAINSSFAAIYWPWVKTFSVYDGVDRWYAPEIYAARQMCETINKSRAWFAPAGLSRGRLTKPVDTEVVLNQGDRDSLYSGGNVINPIVKFAGDGIVIFGQRTAQRTPSALDRVNVRNLVIELMQTILATTRQFAFEPNDRFTWERVEAAVGPYIDEVQRSRGITEFKVVCDETTNTPVRVDRNELWCKVVVKPTKAAEILVFELNVTNQSAQIGN